MSVLSSSLPSLRLVMLIMDDDDLRAMTALALEFAGFRVLAAASSGEAQKYTLATRPHLVVADLRRSGPDDWAFLRHLLGDSGRPASRLVFVTNTKGAVPSSLRSHCASVVLRPVDPAALVRVALDVTESS
jgi:CheY-like chemotaxis protein